MNNVLKFVKENPYVVLLTLFILWMCVGIFPLQCYETDGQEITLGCDVMYRALILKHLNMLRTCKFGEMLRQRIH